MSQDEIDRMAQKAEKSWAESESNKAKTEAKNSLKVTDRAAVQDAVHR